VDDRHGAAGDDHQRDGERLRLARPGGRGHPASDLDLALLVPTQARFEPLALLALRGDLELVAGCPVELAVPDPERGLVHCKEVVAYGATLYVGDRRAVDDFRNAGAGRLRPALRGAPARRRRVPGAAAWMTSA
jgi:hypothetical protein